MHFVWLEEAIAMAFWQLKVFFVFRIRFAFLFFALL